jgi:septum formation protein
MPPLILASTSPYRKLLLQSLKIEFTAATPLFNEEEGKKKFHGRPADLCIYLGQQKAKSLATGQNCVIGSDQMAVLGAEILGKPGNAKKAEEQLLLLQGKTHHLLTSLTVLFKGEEKTFLHKTELQMKELSRQEIRAYIDKDQPFDCAGSYKIEKAGRQLFEKIIGDDDSAIQGLPLKKVKEFLSEFGYSFPEGKR